ncbi:hypothetical protein PRIPAC_76417 [Pristionchus pacificus]|nr:hypothetical protein PRIPAC_76417 [Pristionchus pacificus]
MRLSIIRRIIFSLLITSLILLFTSSFFSSTILKCDRVKPNLRNYPVVIVNHSDVSSHPKRSRKVSFLISPISSICYSNIVVIHSHFANTQERIRLRNIFMRTSFRFLFVLGIESSRSTETLRDESNEFNDLLVVDIEEDYHNITYKAQSWIRYLHEKCADVKWIVKMDDDVEVNPSLLRSLLSNYQHYSKVLIGRVYLDNRVVRNNQSKWFLSHSEYKSSHLGEYLQGMSYVISGDLLSIMRENIDKVQFLWMDDWYVTHALLNGTSSSLIDISPHVGSANSRDEVGELKRRKEQLIFMHLRPKEEFSTAERHRIWKEIQMNCE